MSPLSVRSPHWVLPSTDPQSVATLFRPPHFSSPRGPYVIRVHHVNSTAADSNPRTCRAPSTHLPGFGYCYYSRSTKTAALADALATGNPHSLNRTADTSSEPITFLPSPENPRSPPPGPNPFQNLLSGEDFLCWGGWLRGSRLCL